MDSPTWLPGAITTRSTNEVLAMVPLPQLRDSTHVDGLPVPPPGRHALRALCIDGLNFQTCACGWVREYTYRAPAICGVDEAEAEYRIALWCAEKRIELAKARGERDATALQQALAAERR